jgi:CHAT domain-containing protein/Tfp pilus assembly protein PilF
MADIGNKARERGKWLRTFSAALLLFALSESPFSNSACAEGQVHGASESLETGQPRVRDLEGGRACSYSIRASAGQYIEVVVEPTGIEIEVAVFSPDGDKLIECGREEEPQRAVAIPIIANAPGLYLLEIRSHSSSKVKGKYSARIERAEVASERDRFRVAAWMACSEGNRLRSREGGPESSTAAISSYERAADLYRTAGDHKGEAGALRYLGGVQNDLGKYQTALNLWNRSLSLVREAGDRVGEAYTLMRLGDFYNFLGDRHQALDFSSRALDLQIAAGDLPGQNLACTKLAEVYVAIGERQKALDLYKKVLAYRVSIGDQRGAAVMLSEMGFIYSMSWELRKALDCSRRALETQRTTRDRAGQAYSLLNLGSTYVRLHEFSKALDCYQEALSLHRAMGSRRGEAFALHNLAWAYDSMGEKRKALEHNRQALSIMRDTENRPGEGYVLNSIATILRSLGEKRQALDYYGLALSVQRATGDRRAEAETLLGLASIKRELGSPLEARSDIERAVDLAESLRTKFVSQELRASYLSSVQDFYEFYLDLLNELNRSYPAEGYDRMAFQISERNRARNLLDSLSEARVDIRQGVDASLLQRERTLQRNITFRTDKRIRLLSGKHTDEQVTELTKELESLTAEYQDVEAEIRTSSPRYAELTQAESRSLSDIQQLLDKDTLLLEYALGEHQSYLWAVSQHSLSSFVIDKRAVIESLVRRLRRLLTTRATRTPNESAVKRAARIKEADAQCAAVSAKLARILLGPVDSRILGKRLIVVTDGALQYVPFAALPDPAQTNILQRSKSPVARLPLIVEHEIINLPSASTLALLRKDIEARKSPPRTVAVIADPVFEATDVRVKSRSTGILTAPKDNSASEKRRAAIRDYLIKTRMVAEQQPLARLPNSRKEALAIAALISDPSQRRIILDFEANYRAATNAELGQYRIVHIATHGVLDLDEPELSGILLSLVDENGNPQESGILRLGEIYNLRLPVDMVVLSGCETALGLQMRGEGLIGLTRGFMYAGAPRVLASLWKVNDLATSELMKSFYEGVLGPQALRPADALRRAQIAMLRTPAHSAPYFWSGFVLQGEWR